MDEEIKIIDTKTRNERIKSFILENKNKLIYSILILILLVITFYSFQIYKDNQREYLSDTYNEAVIDFENGDKSEVISKLKRIINDKDPTYSPLALFFLIDKELISEKVEVNDLFDVLIDNTSLEKEIKNLIIYKKGLYNADDINENELLDILKPLISSDSIWRSHSLYLIAEYFYSKNEKEKSKEFFNQILTIDNANQDIVLEAQKRLNRDLSE